MTHTPRMFSLLSHTTHSQNGRADILNASEQVVGKSRRAPSPLGGYVYEIKTKNGKLVYKGNRMSDGLAALEAHLLVQP